MGVCYIATTITLYDIVIYYLLVYQSGLRALEFEILNRLFI